MTCLFLSTRVPRLNLSPLPSPLPFILSIHFMTDKMYALYFICTMDTIYETSFLIHRISYRLTLHVKIYPTFTFRSSFSTEKVFLDFLYLHLVYVWSQFLSNRPYTVHVSWTPSCMYVQSHWFSYSPLSHRSDPDPSSIFLYSTLSTTEPHTRQPHS